jgi:CheY-specific phosphatase CheX
MNLSDRTSQLPTWVWEAFTSATCNALQELMQTVADVGRAGTHPAWGTIDATAKRELLPAGSEAVEPSEESESMLAEGESETGRRERSFSAEPMDGTEDPESGLAWSGDSELIIATIRLAREQPGTFSLRLEASTAARLAARYLGAEVELTRELLDDMAGELANVIAGQAKTMLKGTPYHYHLTTPTIIRESAWNASHSASNALTIHSDAGHLTLTLHLNAVPA